MIKIGDKFHRLTVVREGEIRVFPSKQKTRTWWCRCECGREILATQRNLISGNTKRCVHCAKTKHGESKTHLYQTWLNIKQRCYNPKFSKFEYYGGRGIIVCDEWKRSYEAFRDWALSNGYEDGLTIDRIDNDGNYEPSNCRWVTMKVQNNNKKQRGGAVSIVFNGEEIKLIDLAKKLGINYQTLYWRYRNNKPLVKNNLGDKE